MLCCCSWFGPERLHSIRVNSNSQRKQIPWPTTFHESEDAGRFCGDWGPRFPKWFTELRLCVALRRIKPPPLSPPKLQYFSLLQGLKKMEWKTPYLFLTTPLSIRSIIWACHLQNCQLASISPRSTTWPFDLASANGFTCFIDQEWGRWHIFALSVSTKNESDATKIDVVISCIALRSSSPKLQLPAEASTTHNKH